MAISENNVHCNGEYVGANAVKFVVSMNVADDKALGMVQQSNIGADLTMVLWVRSETSWTERKPMSREMVWLLEETDTLDKEEISAQSHVLMCASTGAGMVTASKVGAHGAGEDCLILPLLSTAMLGSYMSMARWAAIVWSYRAGADEVVCVL